MAEKYDVVIVGAGLAGLSAAWAAASRKASTLVLSRTRKGSTSFYAQGGIAAALGEGDSVESHLEDTLAAGDGLCDEKTARLLVGKGAETVKELIELGAPFDKNGKGGIAFGREGGHSLNRVLHMGGDATGMRLSKFLASLVRETGNAVLKENVFVTEFLAENGSCVGVKAICGKNGNGVCEEEIFFGNSVVIASGGYSALYARSTNPDYANGSCLKPAFDAGCVLTDLEFEQFHPTVFCGDGNFLVSEAVRGEGALLIDEKGGRIMKGVERCELAPRDVVSITVFGKIQGGKKVFLDARSIENFEKRFPTIYEKLSERGLEPSRDLIPVAPAAHYSMGGIRSGADTRTGVKGLFACGEAGCNYAHGANRLASNSLLEAVVFGKIAGEKAVGEKNNKSSAKEIPTKKVVELSEEELKPVAEIKQRLYEIMWEKVGIVRNAEGLRKAIFEISGLKEKLEPKNAVESLELANALWLSELIVKSALAREESRGAHYRTDFPYPKSEWKKHVAYKLE